jgi:hypothetical protein
MRRREKGRLPKVVDTRPFISSPLTVTSPSKLPRASLKRNTSPATVPLIGPPVSPVRFAPPLNRMGPLTVDPCCSSSRNESPPAPIGPTSDPPMPPYQVPVTSTVTSVRSIQSVDAQPEPIPSTVTKSNPATVFMSSASRRTRLGGRIDTPEGEWPSARPRRAGKPTGHLVSTNRQFTVAAPVVGELEHVARHRSHNGPRRYSAARQYPVTFDPCCCSSNELSAKLEEGVPGFPVAIAFQTPVTSTVTSVRSIQSVDAQPKPNASAPAMNIRVIVLILIRGP